MRLTVARTELTGRQARAHSGRQEVIRLRSYLKEKLLHYSAVMASAILVCAIMLYLLISPVYGLYRWQYGFVAVISIALLGAFAYHQSRLYLYYVTGYKCPRCGGLVEMDEISILGSLKTDDGSVPPLIDRISTCTLCGRENHLVYVHSVFLNMSKDSDLYTQPQAKRLQRRPQSAVSRVFGIKQKDKLLQTKQYRFRGPFAVFTTYRMEARAGFRLIGLSEEQIDQIMASERTAADVIGEMLVNYDDWYRLVKQLQQVAALYNQTEGIVLTWPEAMSYIPEGFSPEWYVYGKYEWTDGGYRKIEYASRKDRRKALEK